MTNSQTDNVLQIKVKRLTSTATLPTYATNGSGAFDLRADEASFPRNSNSVAINPDTHRTIGTGLAFEIPPGYVMLVFGRSGMWFNQNGKLGNAVAVIDSDYRGEVKISVDVSDHLNTDVAISRPPSPAVGVSNFVLDRETVISALQTGRSYTSLTTSSPTYLASPVAPIIIRGGDRIAQAMIIPYPEVEFIDSPDLTPTERGEGGFGSTGV